MVNSFKTEKVLYMFSDLSNTYQAQNLCFTIQIYSIKLYPFMSYLRDSYLAHLCILYPWPQSWCNKKKVTHTGSMGLNYGIFARTVGKKNHLPYFLVGCSSPLLFQRIFAKHLLCARPYIPQKESLPEKKNERKSKADNITWTSEFSCHWMPSLKFIFIV